MLDANLDQKHSADDLTLILFLNNRYAALHFKEGAQIKAGAARVWVPSNERATNFYWPEMPARSRRSGDQCAFMDVHRLMCLELKNFVDRISQIFPAIESARPRCTSGLQVLCSLVVTMDRAKLLIQCCTNSSKLYLAITADRMLLRCKSIQNALELYLGQIENMVPTLLAAKISGIIEDLRSAEFHLESSEEEAGKIVLALIKKDIPASDCIKNSEFEALQLAALSLKITSPLAVLEEKRSIERLLDKVRQNDQKKEMILKYLLNLLRKYGELIWQDQTKNNLSIHKEPKCQSSYPEAFLDWDGTRVDSTPKPPSEFECPISRRLMHDPVIIESGKTYERVWIEKWFSEGHETCPITNNRLENLSLTPNFAMKGLISKWCSQHKIIVSDPCRQSNFAPVSSPKSSSPKSIASFGSSMNDLHLGVSSVSLRSSDTNYGSHLIDDDGNTGPSARLPETKEEVCTSHSPTNGCRAGLACLAKLASLPWKSHCKTVQDVKEELNKNEQVCDSMSSDIYMKSLLKVLKNAHDLCDVRAQKESAELILAILSEDRIKMPTFDEDSIYLLASFLDSKISGKALAIMEWLSRHQFYKSEIIASGVLPSILKILDTQITEFHELAVKILCNLSCNSDIAYHIVYLDFLPNLVPFLRDSLSGYCLTVLKNLCCIEEGRNAIAENDSCINSMAKLLESGTQMEQEHTIEVLSLCYEELQCCQLVNEGSIPQSLFSISVNGTSRGQVIAMELLQLLGHVTEGVVADCSTSGASFDLTTNSSSGNSNRDKGDKSSGYLRRKISRFFQ
ncbi:unnamed protein product [Dovyalis caffra]|uniref:RING-type E3 ubiquitin transferase n=1 Tax=Dovyalis caffra TaxID=77055 RepID=A0AAV1S794_9ROSI|nr:unnamed protein product [Dovyalis caffra]